jgi:hypothetical protein
MNIYKKIRFLILVVIFSLTNIHASADNNSLNMILDLGKQMSNIKNMLETYSLLATHVSYKVPKKRLQQDMLEYESIIGNAEKNFKDPQIVESVKKSKEAWAPVKEALLTALKDNNPQRMMEEGLFIHANIRSVIKELVNMKKFLLEKDKIKNGKLLNAAIEIETSSQTLSAHYMMKMWGLPDPTIQEHWDNGVKIYTDSIKILKASPYYKDANFKKLLKDTEKQLKYFQLVFEFDDKFVPVLVHDKAQEAYKSANKMSEIILKHI